MTTNYYCKKCDAAFSEAKLPNINKPHFCGELARVMDFADDGGSSSSEEVTTHH
ncbi:MAG: hypothetical protein AAB903_01395 [Patescibacteria group bacterium]